MKKILESISDIAAWAVLFMICVPVVLMCAVDELFKRWSDETKI